MTKFIKPKLTTVENISYKPESKSIIHNKDVDNISEKHMSVMDTQKFIQFCEDRMASLIDRVNRDCAGGLVDDLAKYNETKMIKEAAERGVFNPPIWE